MKLSSLVKDRIIAQILADVPKIDYNERCRILVQDYYRKRQPPAVKRMLADPTLEKHVTTTYIRPAVGLERVAVRGTFECAASAALMPQLRELEALAELQRDERVALRKKLYAGFAALNTRADAILAFPDFEKYLPVKGVEAVNLPAAAAAAEVKDALAKAGWPKGTKPAKKVRKCLT